MRCKRCGKEIEPSWRVCPHCGANLGKARFTYMRCRACGARVPRGPLLCPSCGKPLRPGWRRPLLVITLLLAAGIAYYAIERYALIRSLQQKTAQVINSGLNLPTLFAFEPTMTPTPTPLPSMPPSVTPTPTHTPTPTRVVPTLTATSTTQIPTHTPLPKPTPTSPDLLPALQLVSPADNEEILGQGADIWLTWEPLASLQKDEWYAVSLRYFANDATQYSGAWQKEARWQVPKDLFQKYDPAHPGYQWDVVVMKQTGTKPDGGRAGIPISHPSETRAFLWK